MCKGKELVCEPTQVTEQSGDPGWRTPGESWISHTAPWTFLWTHQGSDMELFHLIAPKCPGEVGNSDYMQGGIYTVYTCGLSCVLVWIHHWPVDHTPGIFIHPPETHATTTKATPPPSKASMVSVCQVILLPVQIMTVIKQLRPMRGRGQEQAFFTQSNRRQMRITREYRHYDYSICLLPSVLIAIVGVKWMAEMMRHHIFTQIENISVFLLDWFASSGKVPSSFSIANMHPTCLIPKCIYRIISRSWTIFTEVSTGDTKGCFSWLLE